MSRFILLMLLCTLFNASALAQLNDPPIEIAGDTKSEESESDWVVRVGAFGLITPEYQGADDYKIRAFPVIDLEYKDRYFLNPIKGLGVWFWKESNTRLGASLGYRGGRDEDDSSRLEGMGDVDGGMTTNLFFSWQSRPWSADVRYSRQVTGDDTGGFLDLSAGYGFRLFGPIILKPSLKLTLADSNYNKSYFGVTPRQSANSGLPVYDADAGINAVGAGIFGMMFLSKHWSLQSIFNYDRLVGDAADSPVVENKNQIRAGIGFTYQF